MRMLHGHGNRVTCLAYSPDSRLLASASKQGTLKVWDLAAGEAIASFSVAREVYLVAFHASGQLLAAEAWGGFSVLNLTTKRSQLLAQPTGWLNPHTPAAALGWDRRRLVIASTMSGATVVHLGMVEGWMASPLFRHTRVARCLALSPDGQLLALADGGGEVGLHDVPGGTLAQWLPHNRPHFVAFSPDGMSLVSLAGASVCVWDVASGERRWAFGDRVRKISSAAFSPDGQLLATASNDREVRLHDAHSGQIHQVFRWEIDQARSIAFSPDGMTAAVGGEGGRIVVWDVDGV